MINILIGLVLILGVTVGFLFVHIGYINKELKEICDEQSIQNEDILNLMKSQMQHSEVISYLAEQDPLIGKQEVLYPTIVGEA